MNWDPYDRRSLRPVNRWPWWLVALGLAGGLALGLWAWYLAAPESLARVYGQTLGPDLVVDSLDLAVDGQIRRLPAEGSLKLNPRRNLAIKGLNTNRWKNYDLRFYSRDFDVNAVARGEASLLSLFGQDAFMDPKIVTVEIHEGDRRVASFVLEAAFSAADFEDLAKAAVEPDRKIGYYRQALALEPKSPGLAAGFRDALLAAGRKEELIALLEGDLAQADDKAQRGILARLLALYRERKDEGQEIKTLERLLALAEKTGETAAATGYKTALASVRKAKDPLVAAQLYESLFAAAEPKAARGYLLELLPLYQNLKDTAKEESVFVRLLPLASPEESLGLWGEIVRLREKLGDRPGQVEAWEKLAELSPPGEPKANAYKRLGYLKYESQDFAAAEKAYLMAAELRPDAAVYLNLARLALAKEDRAAYRGYLAKALALEEKAEIRLELAQALTQDGLKADAARNWEALLNLVGSGEADRKLKNLAQSQLVGLHRPADGETSEEFEKVLYRHSQESVEFYNLGVGYFQRKNYEKAEKAFSRALELKPDGQLEADARGYLLALYKDAGKTKEMLGQANWIYPADPAKKEVRDLLAHQYEKDQDWAGLVKAATEWTGQDDEAENWRFLAVGQSKLGRVKDAAQSWLKAAQRDAKASSWLTAAQAMEKAGNKPQARLAYERALALEPNNAAAEAALVRLAMESLSTGRSKK
jgi:tetratricopeptide (TPR) repeat protein